jgi:FG-GAP-like repeat
MCAPTAGVVAFDVNADGWADVAVANRGAGGIEVLVNVPVPDSHGIAFEFPFPRFATGSGARAIASADVNRDGRAHLVVGNQSARTVTVLRNTTPRAAAIPGVQ